MTSISASARMIGTALALMISCAAQASTEDGTSDGVIYVTGNIVAALCTVESKSVTLALGDHQPAEFASPGTTTEKQTTAISFSCPASTSAVTLTIYGTSANNDPTLLALTDKADSASGVGVELLDENDAPITLGQPVTLTQLANGSPQSVILGGRYRSFAAVTSGDASSIATFEIGYK